MRVFLMLGPENSIGRSYCLWLLAQELGWEAIPLIEPGRAMWGPLAGTQFEADTVTLDAVDPGAGDVAICYQPLPETLPATLDICRAAGIPLIFDVDEPHWEERFGYTLRQRARLAVALSAHRRNIVSIYRLRAMAARRPVLVSNPALMDRYPGTLVPHIRLPRPEVAWPDTPELRLAFVGTVRPHKGVDRLRRVAAGFDDVAVHITAPPPTDAGPDEVWHGTTSLDRGLEILESCHASVVLSHDSPWTRHQLPVKVIDAMLAGRVVIASDLPPIRWALGGTGILLPPGDDSALQRAVQRVVDDRDAARELGAAARRRALDRFTPAAVAPAFRGVVDEAIARGPAALAPVGPWGRLDQLIS